MKRFLILTLFAAKSLSAQKYSKFENDTLFTSSGYKIFKGQTLTIDKGSGPKGEFRYLKIKGNDNPKRLKNKRLLVERLFDYYMSGLGNEYIEIHGYLIDDQNQRKFIRMKLIFDKAINGFNGFPPEIIVPEEFRKG